MQSATLSFIRLFFQWTTLLAVLICSQAVPVAAQWSTNPTLNNVICNALYNQVAPTIISDGAGGAIITWQDNHDGSPTNTDIYAQRIDALGVVQWTNNGVAICSAIDGQYKPIIVSDGSGGAIIAWYDQRNSAANTDIYAQRINASGTVQWTPNGVAICAAVDNQSQPTIASDGSGGAIIAWNDYRSGTNSDIYAQRINATGVLQWTVNGVSICSAPIDQSDPAIVSDGGGGAIITWSDAGGNYIDIYAQRITSAGTVQWTTNGVGICTAGFNQNLPTIVSDGVGGAIISWQDYRSGGRQDIYAQRVNASGAMQWLIDGVPICTAVGYGSSVPNVISDGAAGAIIVWVDDRTGFDDIYAQRINATGVLQWTIDGVAICTATDRQYVPTIVSDGAGGAVITWSDIRNGTNSDIYAQRINATGVLQWITNGVAICTAGNDQFEPTIVSAGTGSAIITWYDIRTGDYDIYAQLVNASGGLGLLTSVEEEFTPEEFLLSQNYPNPFNPTTRIQYQVSSISQVSLKVYDILGNEVATLVNEEKPAGSYEVEFNAAGLSSGIYFYKLNAGSFVQTKKMILLK
jgi:hypothetical protein